MSNIDLRRDVDFTIYIKRRDSRYCGNYGGGFGGSYGNLRKYLEWFTHKTDINMFQSKRGLMNTRIEMQM